MLRASVLAVAAAGLVLSLAALLLAGPGALGAVVASGVVLAGVLFERARYKRLLDRAPGPGFRPTAERFVDPATGARVTVWADPATGGRAYVRE